MGIYLNSEAAYRLYKNEAEKPYFVDKTLLLEELFPLVKEGTNYVCITRPRRFGKTVMANMITAFFSKARDAADIFDTLKISRNEHCQSFRNQFGVIHISFNDISRQWTTYEQYIDRIERRLIRDLKKEYPEVELTQEDSAVDALLEIYEEDSSARFIFVLDEWDFLFHQPFATEEEKKAYLMFLRSLLKDRPYVLLAYMTGILPIAKYSSGSELNMFTEFTMAGTQAFSEYFGFTQEEVNDLYQRYLKNCSIPQITPEGLKFWYNGYHTASRERVYNPRSVVMALRYNELASYWTSSGSYDEILSAMVVYGFLSYENGKVAIPNKELMDRFDEMLQKEASFGYVYRLARESGRMLEATLRGDTDTMAEILELVHNTETPLMQYKCDSGIEGGPYPGGSNPADHKKEI